VRLTGGRGVLLETPTRSATEDTVAEHIPWQTLSVPPRAPRGRGLYLVAGAIALAVIGVVVGRAFGPRPAGAPTGQGVVVSLAPSEQIPTNPTDSILSASRLTAPSQTSPLTEADLMATPPVGVDQVAMARAEWFVGDYFSIDGGDDRAERIVLAAGWTDGAAELADPLPEGVVSYVEWAKAWTVRQVADRRFEVTVVFRRYVANDGFDFTRLPIEAASIEVEVGLAGASAVSGWPRWEEVPSGLPSSSPPLPPQASIVDAAGVEWPVAG